MQYPLVVSLSGPEKTRAKTELALEKARLTIIPSTEWPILRQSYRAEHWPHMTAWPMARLPDKDEYVAAPHVDTKLEHGFVAVLAETEELFHAAYACVEKHGWVLRTHYELPAQPKPDPLKDLIDNLLGRLDSQEQRIAELTRKLGGHPSIGGAGFETGAGEFMQTGSYSAPQLRRSVFGWAARTAANTPGLISGGLFSATDMQLSAAVSGLVVNTSVGESLVPGTESTSQGGYHAFLSSQNSTTLATANASNPRIDLICATSADSSYTIPSGGTSGFVTIQAVTGTPTAGATLANLSGAPALPASSLLLGYALVPAAATNLTSGNIANKATVVQPQGFAQTTLTTTGSVTIPPGAGSMLVQLIGGGGGGAGGSSSASNDAGGGGGGGGLYVQTVVSLAGVSSLTATIGAGGTAGTAAANSAGGSGGAGGNTTLSGSGLTTISATGGSQGYNKTFGSAGGAYGGGTSVSVAYCAAGNGGWGGSGGSSSGNPGGNGIGIGSAGGASGSNSVAGAFTYGGGVSPSGNGGNGGAGSTGSGAGAGTAGIGYGCGGGGGGSTSNTTNAGGVGGAGGPGVIVIQWLP